MDGDYGSGRSQLQCHSCGKTFAQQNAFSNHLRSCKKDKSRLQMALAGARKVWAEGQNGNKRSKLTHPSDPPDPALLSSTTKGAIRTVLVQNSEDRIVSQLILNYLKLF
jgi:hypothetical protein